MASKKIVHKKKYRYSGKTRYTKMNKAMRQCLRERLVYDERSPSRLVWSDSELNRANQPGKVAGFISTFGRRPDGSPKHRYLLSINMLGSQHNLLVSRVVWAMLKDEDPKTNVIDHRDRKMLNDRIDNLRSIPADCNHLNSEHTNPSGYKNIVAHPYKTSSGTSTGYYPTIKFRGKRYRGSRSRCPHLAFIHLWGLLTSGDMPIEVSMYQPEEVMDGTVLRKALEACKASGRDIKVKYESLYEYLKHAESLKKPARSR